MEAATLGSPRGASFRISTALLLVALVAFPWSAYWLPYPRVFDKDSIARAAFDWFVYDFSGIFFVVAFVAAFIDVVFFLVRRRWRHIPQSVFEMVIALV